MPPIVLLPNPATDFAAKRSGDEVVLRFKVPTANAPVPYANNSAPADLARIEVYAHTGPLTATTDFVKYGTLLATIPVKDPAAPQAETLPGAETQTAETENAATPPTKPQTTKTPQAQTLLPEVEQGWLTSVSEPLTAELNEPGPMPKVRGQRAPLVVMPDETPETVNLPQPIKRYYTIVGVSKSRNRRGMFAQPIAVPLATPPDAPRDLKVSYTETVMSMTWESMPGDLPEFEFESLTLETPGTVNRPETVETAGTINVGSEEGPVFVGLETPGTLNTLDPAAVLAAASLATLIPPPRVGYNVYETPPPTPTSAPTHTVEAKATPGAPVLPLNTALLPRAGFKVSNLEFGVEKCYVVRRVEMSGGIAIESVAPPPLCVTPIDTFAPAAPRQVASVSDDKGVSLTWDANTETDLAGYLVLRGEGTDEKLVLMPLTPAPIPETTYRDTTVQAGRTYTYAVVAIDHAPAPNASDESNRATEVIR